MTDEVGLLERARLEDLRWHWGSAYHIHIGPRGEWVAAALRADGRSERMVLTAPSAAELRIKIRCDYR